MSLTKYIILERKLVRSPWATEASTPVTLLSPTDQTNIAISTGRATFLPGNLDVEFFEKCLVLVLEDLPFLSGRLTPLKLSMNWKMGDIQINNNNAGAEFTVVDARPATLLDCGPDTWPMKDVTISNPCVPFYLPLMDVGRSLLSGKEPLCKVQLTQVQDGCILGITVSHLLTDGMHWPALMRHIAARYRQVITGEEAAPEELISQLITRREGLSLEQLKSKLGGDSWTPEPFIVYPSIIDYFRAAALLWGNSATRIQHSILFLPRSTIARLKAQVAEACDLPVTTGDVVQALLALMVHIGEGRPLLPLWPRCMVALLQIPGAEPAYFGNAVHPMAVCMDSEAALPDPNDLLGTLRALARQIRSCTADVRSNPSKALQAIYESQEVCDAPVLRSLAFLVGHRLPYVSCTTNYIGSLPIDKELDFNIGEKPLGYRSVTHPLARGMGVIRPSMAPYEDGLFFGVSLTLSQLRMLRAHQLLPTLVPEGKFLGEGSVIGEAGMKTGCFACRAGG